MKRPEQHEEGDRLRSWRAMTAVVALFSGLASASDPAGAQAGRADSRATYAAPEPGPDIRPAFAGGFAPLLPVPGGALTPWAAHAGGLSPEPGAEPVVLPEQDLAWARTAWAYFTGLPSPAPGQAPAPPDPAQSGPQGGAPSGQPAPPAPAVPGTGLVPARAGSPVASMWSMGDQVAALLIARRFELIDAQEFDRRFTRILMFLSTMPLAFGELPNRFYSTDTGAMLGADLLDGTAGWSAVDTGRLLIWLRIAAEEHPAFASYIRNAVARWSVCGVLSESGRLQTTAPGENGPAFSVETARGYDAYAIQGYRAWGVEAPLPPLEPSPFEIEVGGTLLSLQEDVTNQAPVMTTPPAYLGLEFGFDPLGSAAEEVAGGRDAEELMQVVHDIQARRWEEEDIPGARADFRRSEEPFTIYGTILANGYPWSVIEPGGAVRTDLPLLTTRGAFALDAFFDGPYADTLMLLAGQLHDPALGWYEGRYEMTGAYETTRTSATNAFVLESIAYRLFGPLFADTARPETLIPIAPDASGACRLPLAAP